MFPIDWQSKILDHDNVNYLKKILGELAMVLDQVEAELEKRKLEYQGEILSSRKREQSRAEPPPPRFLLFHVNIVSRF